MRTTGPNLDRGSLTTKPTHLEVMLLHLDDDETPSVLDFGSVTWGQTVSQPIIVTNNGDCGESVTATASQAPQTPVILNIPLILPGKSLTVTATYDTSMFGSPGDYSFVIDWTATCL